MSYYGVRVPCVLCVSFQRAWFGDGASSRGQASKNGDDDHQENKLVPAGKDKEPRGCSKSTLMKRFYLFIY